MEGIKQRKLQEKTAELARMDKRFQQQLTLDEQEREREFRDKTFAAGERERKYNRFRAERADNRAGQEIERGIANDERDYGLKQQQLLALETAQANKNSHDSMMQLIALKKLEMEKNNAGKNDELMALQLEGAKFTLDGQREEKALNDETIAAQEAGRRGANALLRISSSSPNPFNFKSIDGDGTSARKSLEDNIEFVRASNEQGKALMTSGDNDRTGLISSLSGENNFNNQSQALARAIQTYQQLQQVEGERTRSNPRINTGFGGGMDLPESQLKTSAKGFLGGSSGVEQKKADLLRLINELYPRVARLREATKLTASEMISQQANNTIGQLLSDPDQVDELELSEIIGNLSLGDLAKGNGNQ